MMSTMRSMHTMDCYSAMRRRDVLTQAPTWASLRNMILSEKTRPKRPYLWGFQLCEASATGKSKETQSRSKQIGSCQGPGME